jgi:hypothetical protein
MNVELLRDDDDAWSSNGLLFFGVVCFPLPLFTRFLARFYLGQFEVVTTVSRLLCVVHEKELQCRVNKRGVFLTAPFCHQGNLPFSSHSPQLLFFDRWPYGLT